MAKQKSLPKLKEELDKVFSQFIRLRLADENWNAKCVTCGTVKYWKELQCGHFMSRRHQSTRWNEENTACQCMACNIFNQGEQYKFSLYIDKTYGEGKSNELMLLSKQTLKLDRYDLEQMIQAYKEEVLIHLDRIGELKN